GAPPQIETVRGEERVERGEGGAGGGESLRVAVEAEHFHQGKDAGSEATLACLILKVGELHAAWRGVGLGIAEVGDDEDAARPQRSRRIGDEPERAAVLPLGESE